MHFKTHVRDSHRGPPGLTARTEYADGMIEHDATVGTILKAIDDLGIGNDTILYDGERTAPELLARCRHDTLSQ
jgi:hypothetical protein